MHVFVTILPPPSTSLRSMATCSARVASSCVAPAARTRRTLTVVGAESAGTRSHSHRAKATPLSVATRCVLALACKIASLYRTSHIGVRRSYRDVFANTSAAILKHTEALTVCRSLT
eukprot:12586501-Alexandrium_andersonii.AAC.1